MAANRSSTSSSEPGAAHGAGGFRFPWALVLAIALVAAVELLVRQVDPRRLIPYELDLPEHYAAAAYLDAVGPAEVSVIGSSRTRESVQAPVVRAVCLKELGEKVSAANYAVSSARADEYEAIIDFMLREPRRPRLIVLGISPRDLRNDEPDWQRLAIFWNFSEWYENWRQYGKPAREVLPLVIRNQLARHWLTLRYRGRARQFVEQLIWNRKPQSCPANGQVSPWHRSEQVSLESRPVPVGRVRRYLQNQLTADKSFVFDEFLTAALDRGLAECRKAGVPVLVFETPMSRPLRREFDRLSPTIYPAFLETVQSIADRNGATFVRFDWLGVKLTDGDFREQSHLNAQGAPKFTRALAEKAICPALQKPR